MARDNACVFLALCFVFSGVTTTGSSLPHRTLPGENGGKRSGPRFEPLNNREEIYKCFKSVHIKSLVSNSYYDTVVGCLNALVASNLIELNNEKDARLKLFSGLVEFERNKMESVVPNSVVSGRTRAGEGEGAETVLENNVADGLANLTRNYAMKVRLVEGVKLRVSRGMSDALRIGLVFEAGEDEDDGEDDEDDNELEDEDYEEEEEDTGRQARAGGGGIVPGGGGHGGQSVGGGGGGAASGVNKKKKKKKSSKKKDKEFKEKLPMLLIPFIIQAIVLPLFLANLKLIAIKSIVVGKITLFLVAYNYLRRMSHRRREDNEIEHIAVNHYGYNGDMEYGALVNRRSL